MFRGFEIVTNPFFGSLPGLGGNQKLPSVSWYLDSNNSLICSLQGLWNHRLLRVASYRDSNKSLFCSLQGFMESKSVQCCCAATVDAEVGAVDACDDNDVYVVDEDGEMMIRYAEVMQMMSLQVDQRSCSVLVHDMQRTLPWTNTYNNAKTSCATHRHLRSVLGAIT